MTDIASYLNLLFATIGAAALPAHRRADAEPDVEPDPRGDPVAARRHRDRAARAGVQGLRRGAGLRLHRGAQEGLPPADRRRQAGRHLRGGRARRVDGPAHGRGGRPLRRQPQAREGDQGRHRRNAAGRRRADAGPRRQGREQGGGRAVLSRAVQRDAPLRLRRHRARVLHVQQSRERLPDLRRPRRRQADAPELLDPRPEAQHRRRLLRARGVQVQPGHLGRPGDVQPRRRRCGFSLDTPWEELPETARNAILYGIDRRRSRCIVAARGEGQARRLGGQGGRLRRHRPADRAALPPLPPARRGQLADGGVARQGDGRAHLPRLQRRAGARDAAAVHRSPARPSTTSASSTSTSCTRSSARSSRPAAAPTPAGRC